MIRLFMIRLFALFCVSNALFLAAQASASEILELADSALFGFEKQTRATDLEFEGRVLQSRTGFHVQYRASHKGLPIWGKFERSVHFNKDKDITVMRSNGIPQEFRAAVLATPAAQEQALLALKKVQNCELEWVVGNMQKGYYSFGNWAQEVFRFQLSADSEGTPLVYNMDIDGQSGRMLNYFPINYTATEPHGTVFRHNPVAGSGLSDGHSALAQTRSLVDVPLRGLDGSGYLRGAYVDVTAPDLPPRFYPKPFFDYAPGMAFSTDGLYHYPSDHPAFEEVNAYYWIDSAQRHLQSLGYRIFDRPIQVNCHAFLGFNAYYSGYYKALFFGDGLVQSAEDASVITHEYGHAILDEIVGERFYDADGSNFHEGFSDYFSSVIARTQGEEVGPDVFPEYLGEWFTRPGLSNPPFLRTLLAPPFRFPNLKDDPHENGQLWSSAFYELDRALPPNSFFKILIEALYLTPSASPPDMVEALLQAEQALTQGFYREQMLDVLRVRGLFEGEQSISFVDLVPGENQIPANAEDRSFLRFVVGPETERIVLKQDTAYGFVTLAANYVPDDNHYDKGIFTTRGLGWELNRETSHPLLETGQVLYVSVPHDLPISVSLEVNGPPLIETTVLAANEPWPITLVDDQPNQAKLVGLNGAQRITINTGNPQSHFSYQIYINPNYQAGPEDVSDLNTLSLYVDHLSAKLEVELPSSFQNKESLFLTADTAYATPVDVTLSWSPRAQSPWQELTLNTPTQGALTTDTSAYYTFQIQDLQNQANIVVQSDPDHPFFIEIPDGSTVFSVFQQGIHSLTFQRDSYRFQTRSGLALEDLLPGIYRLVLTGEPNSNYQLSVIQDHLNLPDALTQDTPNEFTLLPNELKLFRLNIPENTFAFSLQFQPLPENRRLAFQLYTLEGQPTSFFNGTAAEVKKYALDYRQSIQDLPRALGSLTPGMDYQLWLFNPEEVSLDINFRFGLETQAPPIPNLEEGTVIVQDWSINSLRESDEYIQPYTVNPPPGTKSVHFSFDHLEGGRDMGIMFKLITQNWGGFLLGQSHLSEYELGFVPDQPFQVYFATRNVFRPTDGPTKIRAHISFDTEKKVNHVFESSGFATGALTRDIFHVSEIKLPEPTRGLEIAWRGQNAIPDEFLGFQLERDGFPYSLATIDRNILLTDTLEHYGDSDLSPLGGSSWFAVTIAKHWDRFTNWFDWAEPLDGRLHVKYHPFETETIVPPVPSLPAQTMSQRRLLAINPTSSSLDLQIGSETKALAPGGFELKDLQASDALSLKATTPIVLFEYLKGDHWTTLTGPSPYQDPKLMLPHLPPSSSPWLTLVSLANGGTQAATLSAPTLASQTVAPGFSEPSLRGQQDQGAWLQIEAGLESAESAFGESRLSGQQYWTLNGFFAAERAGLRPSKSLYIPHVPNLNDWWLGISLTNPSIWTATISISAYDAEGHLLPGMGQLQLEPNSTKTGLLSDFYPVGDTAPTWLHIQSELAPIMGLGFIGNKVQDGIDVGCYGLPSSGAVHQILPGALSDDWYGIALVNPLEAADQIRLDAIGAHGQVLASEEHNIGPRQKVLLVASSVFANLAKPYYLKATSQSGTLLSLQLNGPDLSIQAGIGLP